MLPSILDIAQQYGLISDPKSYGKKESLFKCPFCKQDSLPENKNKYYLSLNTEINVFKCWYCKESGGVLQFESILSNRPYEEIREKYFGKRRDNIHPAYKLTPKQLEEIGWREKKRQNVRDFQENRDQVIKKWKEYEYEQLVKYYALFTLITHFPIQEHKARYFNWFLEISKESKVNNLAKKVMQQANSQNKTDWAIEGREVALLSYQIAHEYGDFNYLNMFTNVLMIYELKKYKNQSYKEATLS